MSRRKLIEKFSEWFFAFKQSPAYVVLFLLWIGGWFVARWVYGFDKELGELNLILSIGAELQGILLITDMARADAHRRRQTENMKQMLEHSRQQSEASLVLLRAIREALAGTLVDEVDLPDDNPPRSKRKQSD